MLDWLTTEVAIGVLTTLGIIGAAFHRLGWFPFKNKQPEKKENPTTVVGCPDLGCKQELTKGIDNVEQQQGVIKQRQSENHDELLILKEGQKTLFIRLDRFEEKIENKVDEALKGVNTLCGIVKQGSWTNK